MEVYSDGTWLWCTDVQLRNPAGDVPSESANTAAWNSWSGVVQPCPGSVAHGARASRKQEASRTLSSQVWSVKVIFAMLVRSSQDRVTLA